MLAAATQWAVVAAKVLHLLHCVTGGEGVLINGGLTEDILFLFLYAYSTVVLSGLWLLLRFSCHTVAHRVLSSTVCVCGRLLLLVLFTPCHSCYTVPTLITPCHTHYTVPPMLQSLIYYLRRPRPQGSPREIGDAALALGVAQQRLDQAQAVLATQVPAPMCMVTCMLREGTVTLHELATQVLDPIPLLCSPPMCLSQHMGAACMPGA